MSRFNLIRLVTLNLNSPPKKTAVLNLFKNGAALGHTKYDHRECVYVCARTHVCAPLCIGGVVMVWQIK